MNTLSEVFKMFTSQSTGNSYPHRKHIERINSLAAPYTVCWSMSHATWHCNYLNDHDVNDRVKWPRCYRENDHNAVAFHDLLMTTLCQRRVIAVLLSPHVPQSQWVALLESRCVVRAHAPDLGTPFSKSAFSFSCLFFFGFSILF